MRKFWSFLHPQRALITALWLAAGVAHAGQYLSQCQNSAQQQADACHSAHAGVNAGDASSATQGIAQSTTSINPSAGQSSAAIAAQQSRIANAIGQCNQAKQQCDQQCQQALSSAQSSSNPSDKADVPGIKSAQQGQCDQPIQNEINQLTAANNALANNGNQAKNTGQSSSGMPPMMMPPSPSPSPSPTPSPAPQLDCSQSGMDQYSECDSTFVSNCSSNLSSSNCQTFENRYCAVGGTSAAASSAATLGSGSIMPPSNEPANLTLEKTGAGLGTPFCQSVSAYRYCMMPGRTQCPSCMTQAGTGPAAGCSPGNTACLEANAPGTMATAQTTCPTDPAFLNPTPGTATNPTMGGTPSTSLAGGNPTGSAIDGSPKGGGSSSSGGGGSSLGLSSPIGASSGTAAQGAATFVPIAGSSAGVGGGGGGGGYSSGASSESGGIDKFPDFKIDPIAAKRALASINAAARVGAPSKEVAGPMGPSLFTLGTLAYKSYCNRSQIKNCQ